MDSLALHAAQSFGFNSVSIESLTEGLIHKTYKASSATGNSIVLQQVNKSVFANPTTVVENYQNISSFLEKKNGIRIPVMLKTPQGEELWLDNAEYCWRAFEFIENSYTENLPASPETIYSAAQCYGAFVKSLLGIDLKMLVPTIPGFHDLGNRYNQLQQAVKTGNRERLNKSDHLLKKVEARKSFVRFYNSITQNTEFKIRAMHHDCKLSNILFDRNSSQAICPIDLDTTMPGYFFSDIGDMIRSMASNTNESDSPESITIQKESYKAIIDGYRAGIEDAFTETEQSHIHHAGLLMIYMQGVRFLADYLTNDVYYKTSYPEQNFDRASNQFALLEKLETFLREEYKYRF